jgi:hypothetical protein
MIDDWLLKAGKRGKGEGEKLGGAGLANCRYGETAKQDTGNKLADFKLGTGGENPFYFRPYFALPSAIAGCPWCRSR